MNGRQLARAVAAQTGKDPKEVDEIISGVTDVITAVTARGEAVTIQGFAKFAVANRAARMGRNPRTGESIRIKASKRVRITPGKSFKEQAMKPSTAPRLARGVWPTDAGLLARQAQERRAGTTTADGRAAGATKAVKKATTKKATTKKATTKKATAKKAPATRTTAKKTAGRATAKKATGRATPAKKSAAKRAPSTRKTAAKRTTAKKSAAKRGAARR